MNQSNQSNSFGIGSLGCWTIVYLEFNGPCCFE